MSQASAAADILTDTVERLSTANTLERVTDVVASAARALMRADGASFILREDDKCFYVDEDAIGPLWKGSRFPMDACVSGWAMLNRENVVMPDIAADARVPMDAYQPTFVKSLAMVPIRREDPIGAVGAYWSHGYTPSHEELRLLEVLANSAAVALENLELRSAVGRRSAERDELESAIHTLVHDLRGPLCTMMGYAGLLQGAATDPEKASTFAQAITRSGEQMDDQIQRMLGLYRITTLKTVPSTVDLSAIGEDVARALSMRNDRPVSVTVEPGMSAELDPVLARLMIENLLDNAFKYTGHQDNPEIRFRLVEPGTPLQTFVVEDNGDGFDPSLADELFRPLARLHSDEEFPGTGLGLASVARIVELHGGSIRAEGRKGHGASFYVALPAPRWD